MPNMILLVEDDSTMQFLGKKQCERLRIQCDTACDGAEAVEKAKKTFALILMDIAMPVMDGIEATLRIRENELRSGKSRAPIVALTAYSEIEPIIAAGIDDYMQKPVMLSELKQIIEKWAPELLNQNDSDKSDNSV